VAVAVEEATDVAGVQIGSQESGFAITTNTPENLNASAENVGIRSVNTLEWLEEFDMASFGKGGEFSNTLPRSNSPNLLSDLSTFNDNQQAQRNFDIFDEFSIYESTTMPPFLYLNSGESKNTSDRCLDLNELPSLSTPSELDVWQQNCELRSIETFSSEHGAAGDFISTPSDSVEDRESYHFGTLNASRENSPSSNTAANRALDSSRPFICDAEGCDRSYRRVHELRRHKRVHSSTRPFSCRFANCSRSAQKGFTRKDHLKQHLRQVHGTSL